MPAIKKNYSFGKVANGYLIHVFSEAEAEEEKGPLIRMLGQQQDPKTEEYFVFYTLEEVLNFFRQQET